MPPITKEELQLLAKLVFDNSGISLDQEKGYLLETRLRPLLGTHGFATLLELYHRATAEPSGQLTKQIIEAMTTNETFFFRDNTPFELLRNKIIPDLIDRRTAAGHGRRGKIPIRIWSAACSTGQEVYSIAMTLMEMLGELGRYDLYILGSDIADKVVAQASYGKYNQFEMERGLPLHYRNRYFVSLGAEGGMKDEVRGLVQFRTMNLMKPFPDLGGKFDVIFCRNVAIYFNPPDKARLFQKIARVLQPDGAFIVGGSETLAGIAPDFESRNYLQGIFYQLHGAAAASGERPPPPSPLATGSPQSAVVVTPATVARGQAFPAVPPPAPRRASAPAVGPAAPLPGTEPGAKGPQEPRGVMAAAAEPSSAPLPAGDAEQAHQPALLPKVKKSLLSAIHASQQQAKPLLKGEVGPAKGSLLSQLAMKKKRSDG